MKKFILVTIVLLMLVALPVFAEDITVGVDVGAGTIQEAIDMANDGDTVIIPDGVYETSALYIDKSISLKGKGQVVININGFTSDAWKGLVYFEGTLSDKLSEIEVMNVNINALFDKTTGFGLSFYHVDGLVVKDVTVNTVYGTALDVHSCNDVVVRNVNLNNDSNGNGATFTNTSNVNIRNIDANVAWGGIGIYTDARYPEAESFNYNIKGVTLTHNGVWGIELPVYGGGLPASFGKIKVIDKSIELVEENATEFYYLYK